MPYDKGDFTQQGVDGKVAGGLLLNNKRDVDVLVSTNGDDSTLSLVAVTIEDHLNDLKYAFQGENLEAGEVYEIGAGGGGDIPLLTITFNLSNGLQIGDETLLNRYDNNILHPQQLLLQPGTTVVTYMGAEVAPDTILGLAFFNSVSVTDLVNCTYAESEDEDTPSMILITDPSQNSSATITI